jgi:trimeric autotransporter adhesin
VGAGTLVLNTGDENTATGTGALFLNTTGFQNTANGVNALSSNTTGNFNTAIGFQALVNNNTGGQNTALGTLAGQSIPGFGNVCLGDGVLGEAGDNRTYIRNVNTFTQNFSA